LAFLPAHGIPEDFNELKLHLLEEASEVTDWLENNYVHSRIRRHLC
jgi:NTP pyrophosphatase (non-canonical NTP hydrolase)